MLQRILILMTILSTASFLAAQPDLIISNISVSPSSPTAGSSYTITATVHNQGSGTGWVAIYLHYYVDGTYVGDDVLPFGLGGGNSNNESITLTAPGPGTHNIQVWVDATGAVAESNENNNGTSQQFTVQTPPQPDLKVQNIQISPSSPYPGQNYTVTATLKNQGNAGVSSSILIHYFVDGGYVGQDSLSFGLGAGNTNNESITLSAPGQGSHSVQVVIDPNNAIPESNENNNSLSQSFSVPAPPLPDLIVQSVSVSPSSPAQGQNYTVTATLKNQGNASVSTSILIHYLIDGSHAGQDTLSYGLGAGNTNNESITLTAPSQGSHTIQVCIDPNNAIQESNEGNNCKNKSLSVGPPLLPDLLVQNITLNPQNPAVGAPYTVTATLKNQGNANASGSILIQYLVDGGVAGQDTLSFGLNAGNTNNENITLNAPGPGPHTITVWIDPQNAVPESNEGNNTLAQTLNVPQPLALSPPSMPPPAVVGQPYQLTIGASGGVPPLVFTAQGLPPGLTITPNGDIQGIPAAPGNFPVSITVTDAVQQSATATFNLVVVTALALDPTPWPPATQGQPYNHQIVATGGQPPYLFQAFGLPPGLNVTGDQITGTPQQAGPFTVQVTVTDSVQPPQMANASYPLNVAQPLVVSLPPSPPPAVVGTPFQLPITISGGQPPYTVNAPGLPPGLSLDPLNYVIQGTPTQAGTFPLTVAVTDSLAQAAQGNTMLVIVDALALDPAPWPDPIEGQPYSHQLLATGGQPPYTFMASGLPPGLIISGDQVTGVPQQAGPFSVQVTVTDTAQPPQTANATYNLNVIPILVVAAPPNLPPVTAGSPFQAQIIITGGLPPYAVTAQGLPQGLTIDPSGLIQGIAPAPGTHQVTVNVTDASQQTAQVNVLLVISPPAAAFTASPTSGICPLTVTLQDQTAGNPTAWSWDLGNGQTATGPTASVLYVQPGTYTIALTVTWLGNITAQATQTVTVSAPAATTAPLLISEIDLGAGWMALFNPTSAPVALSGFQLQVVDAQGIAQSFLPGLALNTMAPSEEIVLVAPSAQPPTTDPTVQVLVLPWPLPAPGQAAAFILDDAGQGADMVVLGTQGPSGLLPPAAIPQAPPTGFVGLVPAPTSGRTLARTRALDQDLPDDWSDLPEASPGIGNPGLTGPGLVLGITGSAASGVAEFHLLGGQPGAPFILAADLFLGYWDLLAQNPFELGLSPVFAVILDGPGVFYLPQPWAVFDADGRFTSSLPFTGMIPNTPIHLQWVGVNLNNPAPYFADVPPLKTIILQ